MSQQANEIKELIHDALEQGVYQMDLDPYVRMALFETVERAVNVWEKIENLIPIEKFSEDGLLEEIERRLREKDSIESR